MYHLANLIWHGHVAFDAEWDVLRPANRAPAISLGIHPEQVWFAVERAAAGEGANAESEDRARGLAS